MSDLAPHFSSDNCPGEAAIAAWSGDSIDPAAADPSDPIAAHLLRCDRCKAALNSLRDEDRFAARFAAVVRSRPGERGSQVFGVEPERPVVSGYTIESEVSRGGQGVVYRAIQHETKRPVAIKTILSGQLASAREVARFEREVEIAASLRHPNIVTVYEARLLPDGRHVLTMELVNGVPLSTWAAAAPGGHSGLRTRLGLILAVTRAVEYAHLRGVIHRDLKPANVLVDREGVPRVLDFGLARRRSSFDSASGARFLPNLNHPSSTPPTRLPPTIPGLFQGTPAYAAPEQFEIEDSGQLDLRVDVYALGVMLFELLAGFSPYSDSKGDLGSVLALKRAAVPPNALSAAHPAARAGLVASHALWRDIDAVIAKATAPDRTRRYQSATEFAADLESLLSGRAVDARSRDTLYRWRMAFKRHRLLVSLATAATAAALAVATGFILVQRTHVRRLDDERARLAAALRESIIQQANALSSTGERARAEALLWREGFAVAPHSFAADPWERALSGSLDERRAIWALMEAQFEAPYQSIRQLDSIGTFVGNSSADRIHILHTDGYLRTYHAHSLEPLGSPIRVWEETGSLPIISSRFDVLVLRPDRIEFADLRSILSGPDPSLPDAQPVIRHRPQNSPPFERAVIARNSSHVALIGSNLPSIVCSLPDLREIFTTPWNTWPILTPTFSPDGSKIYCIGASGRLEGLSVPSGQEFNPEFLWAPQFFSLVNEAPGRASLRFTSTGRQLAVLTESGLVLLASSASAKSIPERPLPPIVSLPNLSSGTGAVAIFDSDDRLAATWGASDPYFVIRDALSLRPLMACRGHEGLLSRAEFSNDEPAIFSIDGSRALRRWCLESIAPPTTSAISGSKPASATHTPPPWRYSIPGCNSPPHTLRFGPDGSLLMAMSDGRLQLFHTLWPLDPITFKTSFNPARSAAFVSHAHSSYIIAAGKSGDLLLFHLTPTDSPVRTLTPPTPADIFGMDVSPDGALVAAAAGDSTVTLWKTSDWSLVATRNIARGRLRSLVWLPDSSGVLIAAGDAKAVILNAADLSDRSSSPPHFGQLRGAVSSRDGLIAITFGEEGIARFWTLPDPSAPDQSWTLLHERSKSAMPIYAVAVHPTKPLAAVGHAAGDVRFIDTTTGTALATLKASASIMSLAFSPDGQKLLVGSGLNGSEVWDIRRLAEFLRSIRQYWLNRTAPPAKP